MVNMPQKKVADHLSLAEMDELIKNKKRDCRGLKKLILLKNVKSGMLVSEASEMVGVSEPTGHRWVDIYNEKGYEGLSTKYENSGRRSSLTKENREELNKILENEDYLSVQRAHHIIKERFGLDFTLKHVRTILKDMNYLKSKPYQIYSQKPEGAEADLKKLKISKP
jgi:transposase